MTRANSIRAIKSDVDYPNNIHIYSYIIPLLLIIAIVKTLNK